VMELLFEFQNHGAKNKAVDFQLINFNFNILNYGSLLQKTT